MQEKVSGVDAAATTSKRDSPVEAKNSRVWDFSLRTAAIGVVAILVVVGGVWFASDLNNRRTVPHLIGKSLEKSKTLLAKSDLDATISINEEIAELAPRNQIIATQAPAAGEVLRAGESVKILVAARDVEVPDYVGMTEFEAMEAQNSGEFKLSNEFGNQRPGSSWVITGQSLAAGKAAPAGSNIVVEYQIPEIAMPELAGKTFTEAVLAIGKVGLNLATTGEGENVISADIPAGTILEPFTVVNLTMGHVMPNVVGKEPKEAREILDPLFSNVVVTPGARGPITAQSIAAGTLVPSDRQISLTAPGPTTTYRITGNGSAFSITWAAPGSFSIQQANGVALPWEKTFATDTGTAVFNAQLQDGDVITCQLLRNGDVVKELTSTGPYAVVQC